MLSRVGFACHSQVSDLAVEPVIIMPNAPKPIQSSVPHHRLWLLLSCLSFARWPLPLCRGCCCLCGRIELGVILAWCDADRRRPAGTVGGELLLAFELALAL